VAVTRLSRTIAINAWGFEPPAESPIELTGEESADTGYETAMAELQTPAENEPVATEPHAIAAGYRKEYTSPLGSLATAGPSSLRSPANVHASF